MGDILRLPHSPKPKKKKRAFRCGECKAKLLVSQPGFGTCENCHTGEALPIGHIATYGHHEGKEVYLASSLMREYRQEGDVEYARDDLEDDIRNRDIFVVWDIERD